MYLTQFWAEREWSDDQVVGGQFRAIAHAEATSSYRSKYDKLNWSISQQHAN